MTSFKKVSPKVIPGPLTVPTSAQKIYKKNLELITKGSGRLFLFAADQKIEHLNQDFSGPKVSPESSDPEHLFKIAHFGTIGAFATHLGLIARYGMDYKDVPYIIKLNGKTNIIPISAQDPISGLLHTVEQVSDFKKKSKLMITGVGFTLYLGSAHENIMMSQAAQIIYQAHAQGLITVLWIYPRGNFVTSERSIDIIAGAAGVGSSLGADFIKVNPPTAPTSRESAQLLQTAVQAAGRSRVVCSGGEIQDHDSFLKTVYEQLEIGGAGGCAVGRNIFSHSLKDAITITQKLDALVTKHKKLKEI